MIRPSAVIGLLALFSFFAAPVHSQQPPETKYPDTPEGLRSLLQDILAVAKSGDGRELTAFVKDMEIPNYQKWFTKTYGKEKGRSWAAPYGRELSNNEAEM